jgi:DNA-binding NarL/FixJ family response regulator
MKSAFLAVVLPDERSAYRLTLQDLNVKVVGEAATWPRAIAQAPATRPNLVLVDWGLIANESRAALPNLRAACPGALVIILAGYLDPRHQAALSEGADFFISKGGTSMQVADRLRAAVASIPDV